MSHRTSRNIKLGDRFKIDRAEPSHKIRVKVGGNAQNMPKRSQGFSQRQPPQRKADELVRNMSNLPSYLERGEKGPEKAFSVGVLQWRDLERWQHDQQRSPHQRCRFSPSNGTTSSFSSKEGSSSYSSHRGHSLSPPRPRTGHATSEYNRHGSPKRAFPHGIKSAEKDGLKSHVQLAMISDQAKIQKRILRRLLDLLLKPKAGRFDQSTGSSCKASMPADKDSNLANRNGEAIAMHSVRLDLGSCKEVNVNHPHDTKKGGSTMLQALFQVAKRKGLPLFTLAVDNSSCILAATVRRLSSGRKEINRWIFTFYALHEVNKRNGAWLNYASKDMKHGYMTNVVGRMKVSDVPTTDLIAENTANHHIREFVLHSTNINEQTSVLKVNDELAATVLKLPKVTNDLNEHVLGRYKVRQLSKVDTEDSFPKVYSNGIDVNNVEWGEASAKSNNLLGLTAILPGGDDGLPCKGKPSTLLKRWRFGGSCDCGGWDMGCRLRVLSSQTRLPKAYHIEEAQLGSKKFQLNSQEQEQMLDKEPFFSLSPFKEGIYSVEFNSSLKLLQTFSICIAVLNCLYPAEFSELSTFFPNKSSEKPS